MTSYSCTFMSNKIWDAEPIWQMYERKEFARVICTIGDFIQNNVTLYTNEQRRISMPEAQVQFVRDLYDILHEMAESFLKKGGQIPLIVPITKHFEGLRLLRDGNGFRTDFKEMECLANLDYESDGVSIHEIHISRTRTYATEGKLQNRKIDHLRELSQTIDTQDVLVTITDGLHCAYEISNNSGYRFKPWTFGMGYRDLLDHIVEQINQPDMGHSIKRAKEKLFGQNWRAYQLHEIARYVYEQTAHPILPLSYSFFAEVGTGNAVEVWNGHLPTILAGTDHPISLDAGDLETQVKLALSHIAKQIATVHGIV